MTLLIEDRLRRLDALTLDRGSHESREEGMCAAEAVAWLAGEDHSDQPACMSPVIGAFLRSWNDSLSEKERQELKPYLPRMVGTAGDGKDELRGWLAADWFVRVFTPAWLELAGIHDSAKALRALPPLRDRATAEAAREECVRAGERASAAWAAASVAGYAVGSAAAWSAAGYAATSAAWSAVGSAGSAVPAAWIAAEPAAWSASAEALEPTRAALKASAHELLDAMIDPHYKDDYG